MSMRCSGIEYMGEDGDEGEIEEEESSERGGEPDRESSRSNYKPRIKNSIVVKAVGSGSTIGAKKSKQ